MVAEEWQDTDEEHGRHEEQEQHMELCMSVWQMILLSNKITLKDPILVSRSAFHYTTKGIFRQDPHSQVIVRCYSL